MCRDRQVDQRQMAERHRQSRELVVDPARPRLECQRHDHVGIVDAQRQCDRIAAEHHQQVEARRALAVDDAPFEQCRADQHRGRGFEDHDDQPVFREVAPFLQVPLEECDQAGGPAGTFGLHILASAVREALESVPSLQRRGLLVRKRLASALSASAIGASCISLARESYCCLPCQ